MCAWPCTLRVAGVTQTLGSPSREYIFPWRSYVPACVYTSAAMSLQKSAGQRPPPFASFVTVGCGTHRSCRAHTNIIDDDDDDTASPPRSTPSYARTLHIYIYIYGAAAVFAPPAGHSHTQLIPLFPVPGARTTETVMSRETTVRGFFFLFCFNNGENKTRKRDTYYNVLYYYIIRAR